jgi:hypothetical protein
MSPRDATKNIDPHSKRIIFDAAEWQERLERLAEMRKEARAERPVRTPRAHTVQTDQRKIP